MMFIVIWKLCARENQPKQNDENILQWEYIPNIKNWIEQVRQIYDLKIFNQIEKNGILNIIQLSLKDIKMEFEHCYLIEYSNSIQLRFVNNIKRTTIYWPIFKICNLTNFDDILKLNYKQFNKIIMEAKKWEALNFSYNNLKVIINNTVLEYKKSLQLRQTIEF